MIPGPKIIFYPPFCLLSIREFWDKEIGFHPHLRCVSKHSIISVSEGLDALMILRFFGRLFLFTYSLIGLNCYRLSHEVSTFVLGQIDEAFA